MKYMYLFVFKYTQKCGLGDWKRGLSLESLQLIDYAILDKLLKFSLSHFLHL